MALVVLIAGDGPRELARLRGTMISIGAAVPLSSGCRGTSRGVGGPLGGTAIGMLRGVWGRDPPSSDDGAPSLTRGTPSSCGTRGTLTGADRLATASTRGRDAGTTIGDGGPVDDPRVLGRRIPSWILRGGEVCSKADDGSRGREATTG